VDQKIQENSFKLKKFFDDGKNYINKNAKKYVNQNQKRVYLDLADRDRSSDKSSSSIKADTRENSLSSPSSYRKIPLSTKLILNRNNKLYDSSEQFKNTKE